MCWCSPAWFPSPTSYEQGATSRTPCSAVSPWGGRPAPVAQAVGRGGCALSRPPPPSRSVRGVLLHLCRRPDHLPGGGWLRFGLRRGLREGGTSSSCLGGLVASGSVRTGAAPAPQILGAGVRPERPSPLGNVGKTQNLVMSLPRAGRAVPAHGARHHDLLLGRPRPLRALPHHDHSHEPAVSGEERGSRCHAAPSRGSEGPEGCRILGKGSSEPRRGV